MRMTPHIATRISVAIILFLLHYIKANCNTFSIAQNASQGHCEDTVGTVLSISFGDCKLLCIQKPGCAAINYNIEEGSCFLIPAPCPQATKDQKMLYMMFTNVDRDECLEWVDYVAEMTSDARWALTKAGGDSSNRVLARVRYEGYYYPGYLSRSHNKCYASDSVATFDSQTQPCQILRVKEGCTTMFVSYTAGDDVPSGAVVGGGVPDGRKSYVIAALSSSSQGRYNGGHYTELASHAICVQGSIMQATDMELLIVV